jgi:ABC-type glycerol-3-phosphate transport system permease component
MSSAAIPTSRPFGVLLVPSAIVTISSTLLGLAVGIPAAYSLARVKFRSKWFAANWILSTIMFPPAVSVVPVFILTSRLGVMDSFPVLIIPYAAFGLPMVVSMLRSYITQTPF